MNEKARVSKELNSKHTKILEGLLKLPENRECADCKSRGPRWASVNLGIFICLHCSGVHKSLGVHISKVRSATLDTWLPEQVAFIQTMGNQKSNSYWEAELPPKYDRVGIEHFIRSKYVDKRWIPRNGNAKSYNSASKPGINGDAEHIKRTISSAQELKSPKLPDSDRTTLALKNGVNQALSVLPKQAAPVHKPEAVQNEKQVVFLEDAKRQANVSPNSQKMVNQNEKQLITQVAKATPEAKTSPAVSTASNKETATLSNIYVKDPKENESIPKIHSVGLPQPTEAKVVIEQNACSTPIENKSKFDAGIEELIKDFQWIAQPVSENPLKNVNTEQQQKSVGQQQPPLIPSATTTHFGGGQTNYQASNGNHLYYQTWGSVGGQVPGNKQMGSNQYLHAPMSSTYPWNPSMFSAKPVAPMNGKAATEANRHLTSSPMQYDFSSLLTHEMLSRP